MTSICLSCRDVVSSASGYEGPKACNRCGGPMAKALWTRRGYQPVGRRMPPAIVDQAGHVLEFLDYGGAK